MRLVRYQAAGGTGIIQPGRRSDADRGRPAYQNPRRGAAGTARRRGVRSPDADGEPGAAAGTAVVLVLLAPSLAPQVARWVPAFPAPSSDGASDHVR